MKNNGKKLLSIGIITVVIFALWTALIQIVDVQPVGQNGTNIGFASLNLWFHRLTGVYMTVYTITDWLGLVPIFICMIFGGIGFVQLVKRKNLFKVDFDIILLGIYYIIVISGYLFFEMIPINYRPILIEGFMEASYPSSTTLVVLSVMPTLSFQVNRRVKNAAIKKVINMFVILFSLFMVIGRTVAGVHWLTDIIGSIILSTGLYLIYKSSVLLYDKKVKS
ncbi:MAG: phosphatase PAP2 family protein [Oscillospiraceae bacterium]